MAIALSALLKQPELAKGGSPHNITKTSATHFRSTNSGGSLPNVATVLLDPQLMNAKRSHGMGHVSALAGLILLDLYASPIYADTEAVRILTFPKQGNRVRDVSRFLPNEIRLMLRMPTCGEGSSCTTKFLSGRRQYICRLLVLNHNSERPSRGLIALLIERSPVDGSCFSEMTRRFHLTQREQEAVGLLTRGLTSKEIAVCMEISPNTVNTFFRSIRSKMSVSTRSGIIGRIVSNSSG